jgi:molybdopterin converting factor small subunit
MITIKLLGGARKVIGKDQISIEAQRIKVNEILAMLRSVSNSNIFNSSNMLIAVNGVEISVLGSLEAQVNDGDVVSVVPVVHGGSA